MTPARQATSRQGVRKVASDWWMKGVVAARATWFRFGRRPRATPRPAAPAPAVPLPRNLLFIYPLSTVGIPTVLLHAVVPGWGGRRTAFPLSVRGHILTVSRLPEDTAGPRRYR